MIFQDLKTGDKFKLSNGIRYIKVQDIWHNLWNVVALDTGIHFHVEDTQEVERIDIQEVIK